MHQETRTRLVDKRTSTHIRSAAVGAVGVVATRVITPIQASIGQIRSLDLGLQAGGVVVVSLAPIQGRAM
jgi:hypothetical protein